MKSYIPSLVDPQVGNQAFIDHFHNLQVAKLVRLVGTIFVGTTKDTNFWTESVAVTGAVSQTGGEVTLTTGATANSSTAQYQTVRLARFIPGVTNIFRWVGRFGDTGTANNIRRWGCFDTNDGYFFQLNGTTLQVNSRKGGVDGTPISAASWNKNTFTMDTNIHSYEIRYSFVQADFYIDEVLRHTMVIIGGAGLLIANPNLTATMQNNNAAAGATTNRTMSASVCEINRLGELLTNATYKNINGNATTYNLKYGAGALHKVTFNNTLGTSLTIYDNTSATGTPVAIITTAAGALGDWDYDFMPFNIGLTIVTVGNGLDATVIYE